MRTLLALLRKDFTGFLHNKAAVILTFAVPFALIYVFGQVFGVNRSDPGPSGIPLAVVNASHEPGADQLVQALRNEHAFRVITEFTGPNKTTRPLREDDLRALMHDDAFRFALVIPADVVGGDRPGLHLKIYSNPRNEIETQTVLGLLQKNVFAHVPQLLGSALQSRARRFVGSERLDTFNHELADTIARSFGGDPATILEHIKSGAFVGDSADVSGNASAIAPPKDLLSQLVRIDTEQVAGKDVKSPAATHIVGGFAMQFLLFALSSSAAALFYERDRGIFQRILSGPVTRSQILWSKFAFGAALGLLQLTVLFVGGRLLYGIDVEHHLFTLLLVCLFAAAACTSFGMLLASVVSTPEAASGLGTLLILLMCSVGGSWFPVSLMPEFIQHFSRLTIVYWAMQGFDQALWLNASVRELLPTLGVLGGITALVMAFAVWRFNRGRIFE